MFEHVATDDLLGTLSTRTWEDDPFADDLVDGIVAYDRVIRAAQARQAALVERMRQNRVELKDPRAELSVVGEVAMARNISPTAAGSQLTLAMGLADLPGVADLLETGAISEPVARAVVNESLHLQPDDLVLLDHELVDRLPGLTLGRARLLVRHLVLQIDPEAAAERARRQRKNAYITMHPDVDGVAWLLARGPAEHITAVHDSLETYARGLHAAGDARPVGTIAVDTLVERVTGLAHADAAETVEIRLVMDARTALADGEEPVELDGHGPVSVAVAEDILARAHHTWVRRLLVDPVDGTLVARDPRRRRFHPADVAFVRARDRRCRQPGCDCRIRHIDHRVAHTDGGPTTRANAQGLCTRSHMLKHQPGWKVRTRDDGTDVWTTPTGHHYPSPVPTVLPRPIGPAP